MRAKKKMVSLLLAVSMIITVFTGMTFAADTADIDGARAAITAGMLDWQTTIDISSYGITESDLTTYIWPEVVSRNPKLFYVLDMSYWKNPTTNKLTQANVTYNSTYTKDSVNEYEAAIDKAFNEVIRTGMSDMQKALALHDYLAQHMEYDTAGVNAGTEKRNAYEALVNGIGVCEGYVLAYAALCEKAGLEVDYCESRALNHIWNYVKIDGSWYHVDVTWDDPITDRESGVSHKYFLCSTDKFGSDGEHTSWDSDKSCTNTSFDNMYWQAEDVSAIFAVNNKEYFVRELKNDQNLYLGGIDLVERTGAAERVIEHYNAAWEFNGTLWMNNPMISLSYYGGSLYFHTADSVYAFNPETDSKPQKIYTYEGNDGVIGASFACDNEVRLVIDKPGYQTGSTSFPLEVKADKQAQIIQFAEAEVTKYNGDIPFTNVLTHTKGDGTITYESSNPQAATVDADGRVTVVGAGNTVISAAASATNDYLAASASYRLTIKENPAKVSSSGLGSGRVIVPKDVEQADKTQLNEAAEGSFKAQFTGKTKFQADIQLIDTSNGQQVHNEEVTFTILYPSGSGITADNYTKYDFAVLHLAENGTIEAVDFVPSAAGLRITSTLSPFIIGYSLKQTETTQQETTGENVTQPGTTQQETTGENVTQPGTTQQPTQSGTSGGEDNNDQGGSDNSDDSDNSGNSGNGQQETAALTGSGSQAAGSLNGSGSIQPGVGVQDAAAASEDSGSAVSPQTGDNGDTAGRLVMFIFVCVGVFGISACKIKKKI